MAGAGLSLALLAVTIPPLRAATPTPGSSGSSAAPYVARPLVVSSLGQAGFTQLSAESTGVSFANQLKTEDLARNQILEVGSGVALGDLDDDGLVDLYFCSLNGANRLYRNLGEWRFQDITKAAGVACEGQFSTGAVLVDIDGDRQLDLLVNSIGGGTRLFRNQGGLRFREDRDAGLIREHGSTSLALADADGDGYLDLYVANYHSRTFKDSPPGLEVKAGYIDGKFVVEPPGLFLPLPLKSGSMNLFERGESDIFYLNNRRGGFVAQDWLQGRFRTADGQPLAEAPKDWGLAVAFRDLNQDGFPDLYVCNDFFKSPDHVWLNDGTGRFRAPDPLALRHTSMSSMAVDFADLNRDGRDDFLVLDMMSRDHLRRHRQRASLIHLQVDTPFRRPEFRPETPRNTLFLNRGDGTYTEIAQYSGIEASEWSWGVAFLDVDLDGYEDALVTNGNARDANDADLIPPPSPQQEAAGAASKPRPPRKFPRLETANVAFRNRGDLTFEEVGKAWGFATVGVSHGIALADLDNDGDLDVVINHLGQPAGLYRNNSPAPRVHVRLKGRAPNTQAIGARVEVNGGATPRQSQEIMSGGRYLSGDAPGRSFAAGTVSNRLEIRVTWRNGTQSSVTGVLPNQTIVIQEPESPSLPQPTAPGASPPPAFFSDVSSLLRHPHRENEFRDDERQPLLIKELSRLGPGIAWRDLDEDGREDLIVGGSKEGHFVVYLNEASGKFKPLRRQESLTRDQTSILTLRGPGGGGVEILTGSASYEDGTTNSGMVRRYDLQQGTETAIIPDSAWSVGPVALGVLKGSAHLFVGGRVRPGRYPNPTGSHIYRRDADTWRLDPLAEIPLSKASLATGATWSDLEGDGEPELLVTTEWGPVHLFRHNGMVWEDQTEARGLAKWRGIWSGVAAGDFDEDGRLDFVAANWGRNSRYERHRSAPIRIYYGDWHGGDQLDLVEAYFEPSLRGYAPFVTLDKLRSTVPALAEPFPSFQAYAQSTADRLASSAGTAAVFHEANWLETTLFLNRGDHFEPRPLPPEAQWAPAFGVSVADLDGDGHEDVFLSQNFSGMLTEECRLDGGLGVWLRGDGHGGWQPMSAAESGIRVPGDGRGTAFCDFDRDGRTDLAVAQNDGPVKLFRNVRGRPGLRVRLRGPSENPDGFGAVLRLRYPDGWGPARVVTCGSGHWSQESLVPVLGLRDRSQPTALWVRWPGGLTREQPLAPNQTEIAIAPTSP